MNVLKNNYNGVRYIENATEVSILPYPRQLVCENCHSELEYEKSDMRMGQYGCMFVDCPLCGYDNMLEDNEHSITLTVDNIEFPIHFHHVCVENGAVNCCSEDFKKYLREAISYFRKNKNECDWGGHITGNLYLHVHRYEDDRVYDVAVSNDFYTMDIPFESEDLR